MDFRLKISKSLIASAAGGTEKAFFHHSLKGTMALRKTLEKLKTL